jgi:hypothetical protein
MANTLDQLSEALLGFAGEGGSPAPPAPEPTGNAARTLEELSDALLSYLTAVEEEGGNVESLVPEVRKKDDDTYSGIGFRFDVGVAGGGKKAVTALLVGIEHLFSRVCRYTAQKARFIAVGGERGTENGGATNVDLYAFSADERDLYRQFLREGANRLWELLIAYAKDLPFKGYLFDEGVGITNFTDLDEFDELGKPVEWPAGSFVRVGGQIYKALEDVPEGVEITDTAYWKAVSGLYGTLGKVVFFVDVTSPVKSNSLVQVLNNVEDFLYSFVLWRWYVLSGIENEAQVWNVTMDAAYGDVKRSLLRMWQEPVLRRAYPY